MDPSQAGYAMAYPGVPRGYPGMMPGYPMGYQAAPFPYGNMMVSPYAYGYPQQFGYQLPQGAAFDPRQQAFQFQMAQPGRGYNPLGPR